ncbi:prephenate dehydratase [Aquidulcibacter sp.]|uniref:prephenate dehydratase n=1 Tax=Aquidulcibacter sp. TaxID=2052990 RepID=UPI0037BE817E
MSDFVEGKIAFQGELGANSHAAAKAACPSLEPLPCQTFEDAFAAVAGGKAVRAMIAIENTLAGRVGDVHHLLPEAGLYIVGEYFAPIHHQLVGVKGATLSDIKKIRSHPMALGQCRKIIRELGAEAVKTADTAGAVREISEMGDKSVAALGSTLAAAFYDLPILRPDVEDEPHNATRFVILSATPDDADLEDGKCITSFVFQVRNIPAALYKAMGGFATNGVNMTKLESYQIGGSFNATQFYADIEGHPNERNVQLALQELKFFSAELKVLGVYKAHAFRKLGSGTPAS